jgi:hypothetical protein
VCSSDLVVTLFKEPESGSPKFQRYPVAETVVFVNTIGVFAHGVFGVELKAATGGFTKLILILALSVPVLQVPTTENVVDAVGVTIMESVVAPLLQT